MELPKDKKVIRTRNNKVVYDCGDTVDKVFNATKPAADIFNEALNLSRAEQAGIDVPEIVEVGKAAGSWVISTKKVEGKTMREIGDEDASKRPEITEQFVELQLDIHKHRNPLLNRQKDKYTRMINAAGEVLDETTRYELLMRLDGMPNKHEICHGDFVPSNVIVREDGSCCVCDWAHATQGDGAADCAASYLHFKMRGADEFAENYLNTYCEKSGVTKEHVQNWLPIIAASELSRGRVVEQDFLLSWVNVADYQ
jgi:tRNA A-37 threonylcarbamoyl transferase component Bud32